MTKENQKAQSAINGYLHFFGNKFWAFRLTRNCCTMESFLFNNTAGADVGNEVKQYHPDCWLVGDQCRAKAALGGAILHCRPLWEPWKSKSAQGQQQMRNASLVLAKVRQGGGLCCSWEFITCLHVLRRVIRKICARHLQFCLLSKL